MAKVFIEETTLTAIGDAIRGKTGKTDLIDPANMSTEIAGIEAGGGGYEPPEEAFMITGDCDGRFRNNNFAWFINDFAHRITTQDITKTYGMFANSRLITSIPFIINVKNITDMSNTFISCEGITTAPKIRGTFNTTSNSFNVSSIVDYCYSLRDAENVFLPEDLEPFGAIKVTSAYSCPRGPSLKGMYSLRQIPSWWYKFRLNPESTAFPASSYSIYNDLCTAGFALDEIRNIPVWVCQAAASSNLFSGAFSSCNRLKAITFETNSDGSPIVTQWKGQTINISNYIGWQTASDSFAPPVKYNSGITLDKKVYNDATYQSLKNDPDWYACAIEYSRYNHDSAVETINSLPDTSAYLASAGGTNTIKFNKAAGSKTDGGACGNLTEEEIAVAAAKGWTVTLA
jgi:hypothetical protein